MRYKVNAKDIRVLDVYTSLSRRFFGGIFFFRLVECDTISV